jgi:hypothetical protein
VMRVERGSSERLCWGGGGLLRAWLLRACLRAAVGRGLVWLFHGSGVWARLGAPSLVCGGFARKSCFNRLRNLTHGLRSRPSTRVKVLARTGQFDKTHSGSIIDTRAIKSKAKPVPPHETTRPGCALIGIYLHTLYTMFDVDAEPSLASAYNALGAPDQSRESYLRSLKR